MQVNVLPEGRVGAPVPTAGTSGAQRTRLRATRQPPTGLMGHGTD